MTATVIQHDIHEVACRCGRVHRAKAPAGAGMPGTVTYGISLQAWYVYLMAAHAIPVHRCAELTEALTGARPSQALPAGRLHEPADLLPTRRQVDGHLRGVRVPRPDRRGGPRPVPELRQVPRHHPPAMLPAPAPRPSRRCGELPGRDLARPGHRGPAGPDPPGEPRPRRRPGRHPAPDHRAAPAAVPARCPGRLSEVRRLPGANVQQPPARLLLECLHDRDDDVLRFLSDLRIPPTSNQAERDVRPAKTQQKISGRLRSEDATRHRHAIRGHISTAAKHGASIFTAPHDALTGNP